jgi:hypothetical protein
MIGLDRNKEKWVVGLLFEQHHVKCECSYCKSCCSYKKLHYGLNIPRDWKASNSWYVIKFPFRIYIRTTYGIIFNFKRVIK